MAKKILIVDADLIAYRHAAAAEKRTVIVKHLKSGREKEFDNRTELKNLLKSKGFEYKAEDYSFEDVQTPKEFSLALATMKRSIEKLQEFTWCDSIELYLGSGETFRHKLPLPSPYKNNRSDSIKPIHLQDSRKYLTKQWGAKLVKEIETDDIVTIRAYEELEKGNIPIIATVDKDSYQSQGVSILDWTQEVWKLELIPDVGELRKQKTSIKGNGLKFLAFQALAGDAADTYCGYELSCVKYGPAKAMKALEGAQTEQEVVDIMLNEFKLLYPDEFWYLDCHGKKNKANWSTMLDLYWRCAYMKRSKDDQSNILDFLNSRGLSAKCMNP
jgi:hypothetical protein